MQLLKSAALAAVLIGIGLVPCSAGALFLDGTFNLSDWSRVIETGSGTVTPSQVATGGNPGDYMRVDLTNFTGLLGAYQFRSAATYDPASQGAIASVAWSLDELGILALGTTHVAAGGALTQNNINYYSVALNNIAFDVWRTFGLTGLGADNFATFLNPNAHPDFSASGAPITFGFWTVFNNGSTDGARAAGFDNWTFGVTTVPEPSSFLLLGAGLALLCRRQRTWPLWTSPRPLS